MRPYTVLLLGHSRLDNKSLSSVEKRLREEACRLISENGQVRFLIGYGGEFKDLSKIVIEGAIKKFSDSGSKVEILTNTPDKYKRFSWLNTYCMYIDNSDYVIVYSYHKEGLAYFAYEYAKSKGKPSVNIAY